MRDAKRARARPSTVPVAAAVGSSGVYWSINSPSTPVACVWFGDAHGLPGVGHRSDPLLGPDIVIARFGDTARVTVQGPVTQRTTYPHVPGAEYFGVRLRPGVGSPSSLFSLAEAADRAVEADALDALVPARLEEVVLGPGSLRSRAQALARMASEAPIPEPDALISAAMRTFRSRPGPAPVRRAAYELGVSERHLQRIFRATVGVSPSLAARLVRIDRLQHLLSGAVKPDLATAALRVGFADQAHMAHETRRFLSATPSELLKADFG